MKACYIPTQSSGFNPYQYTFLNRSNLHIERTGHLTGTVSYSIVNNRRCKTMHINLNYNPLQCTDNCVLWNSIPCPFAIVFILDNKLNMSEYVPKKFTVNAGIKCLKILPGTNQNISYLDIDFENIGQSSSNHNFPVTLVDVHIENKQQGIKELDLLTAKKVRK